MSTVSLADSVLAITRRRVSGSHEQIIAASVQGLIKEAIKIIENQVNNIGYEHLAELTERTTQVSITVATLKNWVIKHKGCLQLNKLNAVLNACGYTLLIGKL